MYVTTLMNIIKYKDLLVALEELLKIVHLNNPLPDMYHRMIFVMVQGYGCAENQWYIREWSK